MKFVLDQPWNSEANQKLLSTMPDVFRHPNDEEGSHFTHYLAVRGKNTVFDILGRENRSTERGLQVKIILVSARNAIPWTQPGDMLYDGNVLGIIDDSAFRTIAMTLEGGTVYLTSKVPVEELRWMIEMPE